MKDKMTGKEALSLLELAKDYVDEKAPFLAGRIHFDNKMTIRESSVRRYSDDNCHFRIGIKEYEENQDKLFSANEVMMSVVGLFHESCGHGAQIMHEFNKIPANKRDLRMQQILALNYYACQVSERYYMGPDITYQQYYHQVHEIAAQYMAVKCTKQFLTDKAMAEHMPVEEADARISSYIQFRVDNESEVLDRTYDTTDEILEAFDKKFQESVYSHREYQCQPEECDLMHDFYTGERNGRYPVEVDYCRNGVKQDLMMAAVYMQEGWDGDDVKNRNIFKFTDFSIKSVFGFYQRVVAPVPNKRSLSLKELDNVLEDDGMDGP